MAKIENKNIIMKIYMLVIIDSSAIIISSYSGKHIMKMKLSSVYNKQTKLNKKKNLYIFYFYHILTLGRRMGLKNVINFLMKNNYETFLNILFLYVY